jgi:hypothetical protein
MTDHALPPTPERETRAALRNAMSALRDAYEAALHAELPSAASMIDHARDAASDAMAELDDLTRPAAS